MKFQLFTRASSQPFFSQRVSPRGRFERPSVKVALRCLLLLMSLFTGLSGYGVFALSLPQSSKLQQLLNRPRGFVKLFASRVAIPMAGVTYYSQGSVNPATTSNWNTARGGGGSSPANFTGGDIFVIQNTHSMSTAAAWTVSGTGATIQIESGGTLTANNLVAVPTFQVDNGGTYIHNAASGAANGAASDVPGSTSRTFGASSTVEFQTWANGGTSPVALPNPVTWGNLKINVATLAGSWAQLGTLTTVAGNLIIQSTGGTTREFRLNASSPTTSTLNLTGDLQISGGILNLTSGTAVETVNLGGNFNQSGGTLTATGAGPHTVNFTGASKTFTQSAGTFTNTNINWAINNTASLTLSNNFPVATSRTLTANGTLNCGTNAVTGAGAFTLASGGTLGIGSPAGITSTAATGNIQVTGTRTYNTGANYTYNGSANQATGNQLPATVNNLTIANTGSAGSNVVTLGAATTVNGTLTLTSGLLTTTSTNLLTIANTAANAVSGGSASSYVNGLLARVLPASLVTGSTYVFPIGKTGYNPFELVNPTTNAGGTVTVQAEEFDASSGGTAGTGLSALNTNRYWQTSLTVNPANFTNTMVRLTDSGVTAANAIGQSTTQGGSYNSIGGTVVGSTIASNTISSLGFFNIGTAAVALPPTITADGPLTRQQGSAASNETIATVSDSSPGALTVTATTVPTGLTVTNIVNNSGTVTADVAAGCAAATGANTVVLTVTNGTTGLSNTANLTVNVDPNTPPELSYDDASVLPGTTRTLDPATGPDDNGTIASIVVQSVTPATTPGTLTVNNTTGVVTVPNNVPAGTYTVTIRATDDCGGANGTTDATFTLTVGCPTTFTVDDTLDTADANPGDGVCGDIDSICTLRAAIMEANALAATACTTLMIDFSVTGTIDLGSALPALNHPNLTINGPGANLLTVRRDVAMAFRIFTINSGRTVALNGLTIANGSASTGGGLLNNGTLTLNQCVVSGNTATSTSSGGGGGIDNRGVITLTDSTLTGNTAAFLGGGLWNVRAFGSPVAVSATLTNCTLAGNQAGSGGALHNQGGTVSLTNCTISGNTASLVDPTGGGAGLENVAFNFAASATLTNCTFNGNQHSNSTDPTADDIYSGNFGFQSTVTLKNTILGGSAATATPNLSVFTDGTIAALGVISSQGHNLSSDGGNGFLTGTGDLINTNPLLALLGSYGGTTQTHALLPGSPALNAGDGCVLTVNGCGASDPTSALTTDQRGSARVGNVDIGAFESQGFALALSGGSPQTAVLNTNFANPLAVTVTANNASEPVNGGQVIFTPPGSGASAVLVTSPATIASGAASVTATANGIAGSYNVAATANGGTPTVNFVLTNNAPSVVFAFSAATTSFSEADGSVTFTVTRTATGTPVSVDYATGGGTATPGVCAPGVDYVAASGTLNFAANDTQKTFNVTICNDAVYELNQTFNVTLSNAMGGSIGTPGTETATITNDDAVPTIAVSDKSQVEGNSGTANFTINVTLTGATEVGANVSVGTSNGTATAGSDYTTFETSINFVPGPDSPTQTVPVPVSVFGDTTVEPDETFFLTASNCDAGCTISGSQGVVTILNDDATLQFSSAAYPVAENVAGGQAVLTVTRTGFTGGIATVNYATGGGTATAGVCAPGVDYVAASGTLTFNPGDTSKPINVTICNDAVYELDQTFNVTLSTPTGAALATPNPATVTITNDDAVPTIAVSDKSQVEGNSGTSNFTINVTLTGATEVGANVSVGTSNGTATAGSDYTTFDTSINFVPGPDSPTQTVPVPVSVFGDTLAEPDETFFLTASNCDAGCTISGSQGVVTILNDDCPTTFTVNDLGDAGDANPGDRICATSGGVCTLRAAIQEANALTSCTPLTINFSVTGTINLATVLPNLNHPNLTITGPGAGLLDVHRNVSAQFRIFTINSGKIVNLSGLSITNGNATGVTPGGFGGGIISSGILTINNCAISGNQAENGGGLTQFGGSLNMTNSTVSGNTTTFQGSGVNLQDTTATLTNCTISGNVSQNSQGGIANLVFNSTVSTLNLINCTITNNTSVAPFGAVWSANETSNPNANPVTTLKNTLVASNVGPNFITTTGVNDTPVATPNGLLTSLGNNLDSDGTSGFSNGVNGDIVGTLGSPLNALLAALGNYGGPTNTHALLPGSPAINAGTSTSAPTTDQRGSARVGNVDIGAFESQGFVLALSGGSPQTAVLNTNFANPLAVTVTANNASEPVNGGQVIFTPPGSGATATLTTSPATIASGAASVTATANGTAGSYNVAATANGSSPTVNFALTNNVAPTVTQLVRGNQSPNSSASITFSVIFSEPVTSASASNFTLVPGGGVTGASITNVVCNMAGQSCVVTVNTGTGSGTLGLNMTSSTGVTDSGGAGLSNLPVIGEVYTIDKDAPDTTITAPKPTNPTSNTSATFTFTGSDTGGAGVFGFECKLDMGNFMPCTSPQNYTGLADGSHTFQVRAVDTVGNVDATPDTYTWVVDTLAPDTTITANPPNPSNSSNASFSFTGNDGSGSGVASFECKLDMGSFTACTSPQSYSGLTDGPHTFQVRAIDNAGNVDATPASYTWTVDTTPPVAPVVVTPANGSVTMNPKPAVTGSAEPNSTVTVFIDGSSAGTTPADSSGNWSFTPSANLSDGSHTVRARATDAANNTSVDSNTNTFIVDTAAPDTSITSNPANVTNSTSASFSFTGNDGGGSGIARFECKLDAGSFVTCTSPQSYSGLADGSHTFQVRAIDNAGNVDAIPATYTWTVDTIAPTVTINQAAGQADPTGTSPINFTAVFNEAVTGFGAGDVVLSGTAGAASFVVTEIAPLNGTTYNVAVSGMNANGTVIASIPAGSVQDLATNPNTASTSTDPSVTFTLFTCPTAFTVNDLGDTPDANVGEGQCKDAANKCTLRAALMEANSTAVQACAPLTINFSVTGTINLATALPDLNHPNLTINGPGASQLTVQRSTVVGTPDFRIFTNQGSLTIKALTITGGHAVGVNSGDFAGYGGGIFNNFGGVLTVSDAVITGNSALFGGGGIISFGPTTITQSDISSNSSQLLGGGLVIGYSTLASITNTTFSNNTSSQGAVSVQFSTGVTISNSTISGNSGAGIENFQSQVGLINCTVAHNPTQNGFGGVYTHVNGTTTLSNTLVANNSPQNFTTESGSQLISGGYNLDTDGSSGFTNGSNGNLVGTGASPLNALLAPLGNYGGPTPTHALLPGSPALNAGNNCVLSANGCGANNPPSALTNDQRGLGRVGAVDIGAVEAQAFTLAITGGNNQSTPAATAFALPLQVNLKEGPNNLPGAVMTFTGPSGGAGLNPVTSTATTDANGTASRSVTANTVAGGPYSVTATTGGLNQTFTLTNLPGAPAQLAFGQQPTTTPATFAVTPPVTVRVLDAFGNLTPSNALVTLAFGANPGGATLGGTSVNAVNGVATFSALTVSQPGTGYTLAASSPSLMGATSQPFNVTCPPITLSAIPNGVAGTLYQQTLTALPAGGNYSFALTGGALPNGVTLAPNGTLSGTPTVGGTFNFTVQATGFGSCTGTRTYALVIACPAVTLTPANLPTANVGANYSTTIAASPTGTTYTYLLTTNILPPGLTLDSATGVISGTPTAPGNYAFVITALGWGDCRTPQMYNLLVTATCPAIIVTPLTLTAGSVGSSYSQALTASGGTAPYSFTVTAGTLPPGVSLTSAGSLSGTPTAAGTFSFTVTATGAGGCTGSRSYNLVIACPALSLLPAVLPNATAGINYSQTIEATPAGAYIYSIAVGNLPPGLNLDAQTGVLSGLATVAGSYSFTLKAERGAGCAVTRAYTLIVVCPTIGVNPASLSGGAVGAPYSQNLSATPSGSYNFTVSSGALPNGLTLSNAGELSGTPTTAGTYSFTVRATAFGNCSGTRNYTVTITAACETVTLPSLPGGALGANYYGDLTTTTPSGSYTFSVTSGTLPPGLTLDNLFGAVLGTPTLAGTYNFTLQATSANGCTGTRDYTLAVNGGAALAQFADFDGDGVADPAVWRATTGGWEILLSASGRTLTEVWGGAGDVPVLGDYDGDGRTDLAIFRPSNGTWYVKRSNGDAALVKVWGGAGDVPLPGDYDGDGKTDIAVWRGAEGRWYIQRSTDGAAELVDWGSANAPYQDVPVASDYDGDGKTDLAVFRRATGEWLVRRSRDGLTLVKAWGAGSDIPVAADYDGDGKADLAVWRGREGKWYVLLSGTNNSYRIVEWGAASAPHFDEPSPGDYDGDGQADIAVWRGATGQWFIQMSRDGSVRTYAQGQRGDQPLNGRRP